MIKIHYKPDDYHPLYNDYKVREINFEKFPNNETLLKNQFQNLPKEVIIAFKYVDNSDFMKLMMVKKELDKREIKSQLSIVYMPYSRMDRGSDTICFTLSHIVDFLIWLDFEKIFIFEPHSDVCVALLEERGRDYSKRITLTESPFVTTSLIRNLKINRDMDYIVFPDKGAYDRYFHEYQWDYKNILYADKQRDFETGRIKSLDIVYNNEEIHPNAKAYIIDDLCSYGGTFVLCAKKLKELGFKEVNLVVAHCEESILKGKIPTDKNINKVYTTNSIINKEQETEKIKITEVI